MLVVESSWTKLSASELPEQALIIRDEKMNRIFILLDAGKPGNGRVLEIVVGVVVVDGRDLGDEDVCALRPETMPVAGLQRHAFAGGKFQLFARPKIAQDPVAGNACALVAVAMAISIAEKFEHQ